MPILPLVSPVSRPDLDGVGNLHARDQASNCGEKSLAAPGTLYSYGPR